MFHLHVPEPNDRLEWIGGDDVEGEAAEVAYEAVVERGLHRAAGVADCVADLLMRRDLDAYGPSVDVGFFRRSYVAEAYRVLGRLEGTLLRTTRPTTER
jgi:hypothetical protein